MEMIAGQLKYFAASFLFGVMLMFAYDFILVFRGLVGHSCFARWIEDWLFWLISAVLVFQMVFSLNNGVMRSFFVVSFVAGMILYRRSVGKFFVRIILGLFGKLGRICVWIRKKLVKKQKNDLK